MNVILVGNYEPDGQMSMLAFGRLLKRELEAQVSVTSVSPHPLALRCLPGVRFPGLRKWLGYVDKFFLFPPRLRKMILSLRSFRPDTVVHVLDHSNAAYTQAVRGIPSVVTCHDLLAIRSAAGDFPENPVSRTGRVLQKWIWKHLRSAPSVVCDSQATREDYCRLARRDPKEIRVVPVALNFPFLSDGNLEWPSELISKMSAMDGKRRGEAASFFLHVGNNSWYKNRRGLLEIYSSLIQHFPDCPDLLIAGRKPEPDWQMRAQSLGLAGRIVLTGEVEGVSLNWLYSHAAGLIFPSLQEGFGWPILEAQACGCPVFTSNRAPMTEVGGDAAVYFDPTNPQAAAQVIAAAMNRRNEIKMLGLRNVSRFSAEAMLDGYLASYQKALADQV